MENTVTISLKEYELLKHDFSEAKRKILKLEQGYAYHESSFCSFGIGRVYTKKELKKKVFKDFTKLLERYGHLTQALKQLKKDKRIYKRAKHLFDTINL
jgi:hypothetical protein